MIPALSSPDLARPPSTDSMPPLPVLSRVHAGQLNNGVLILHSRPELGQMKASLGVVLLNVLVKISQQD